MSHHTTTATAKGKTSTQAVLQSRAAEKLSYRLVAVSPDSVLFCDSNKNTKYGLFVQ